MFKLLLCTTFYQDALYKPIVDTGLWQTNNGRLSLYFWRQEREIQLVLHQYNAAAAAAAAAVELQRAVSVYV